MSTPKVAVLVGSLRKDSINRKLGKALARIAEGRLEFQFIELGDLPMYNDDLWADPPAPVLRLKAEILAADAFIMLTPEYNRGVPAVLKNAFDWATRPSGQNAWAGKPGAVGGAAIGVIGTAVAQSQLRNSLLSLKVVLMGSPELYFHFKPGIIDDAGKVHEDAAQTVLANWIAAFVSWIDMLAHARPSPGASDKVPAV